MNLRQSHPLFVAEATDVDLSQPLSPAETAAIERAMDEYGVLVFPDQSLTQPQQIRFAESFGPLDLGLRKLPSGPAATPHRLEHEALIDISNVGADGQVARLREDDTGAAGELDFDFRAASHGAE